MTDKKKMICTECFNIVIPTKKTATWFGDYGEIVCHAPPCGDGCNEDSSVMIYFDSSKEELLEHVRDRLNFIKDVSDSGWQEVDFLMKNFFKIKYVVEWHQFLASIGMPKYRKFYKKAAIEKWKILFTKKGIIKPKTRKEATKK